MIDSTALSGDDLRTFRRMARDYPLRTGLFTFGLPLFALLQMVNGYLHGGSLPLVAVFCAVTVAFSLLFTSYHVTAYRRERLVSRWMDEGEPTGREGSPGSPG